MNLNNCKKIELYIEYKGLPAERLGKALFGGKTLYDALKDAADLRDVDIEDYILDTLIANLSIPDKQQEHMKLDLQPKESGVKHQIGVQIWKSDYDHLREIARSRGVTLAMLARSIINDFIEKTKLENTPF